MVFKHIQHPKEPSSPSDTQTTRICHLQGRHPSWKKSAWASSWLVATTTRGDSRAKQTSGQKLHLKIHAFQPCIFCLPLCRLADLSYQRFVTAFVPSRGRDPHQLSSGLSLAETNPPWRTWYDAKKKNWSIITSAKEIPLYLDYTDTFTFSLTITTSSPNRDGHQHIRLYYHYPFPRPMFFAFADSWDHHDPPAYFNYYLNTPPAHTSSPCGTSTIRWTTDWKMTTLSVNRWENTLARSHHLLGLFYVRCE